MLLILATLALTPPPAHSLTDARLAEILQGIRDKAGIPALAASVAYRGKVVAQAAVGVRKWGDPTPVKVGDRFHVGSITKSVTATMIACLVREGKLDWNDTPYDIFPELRSDMDPAFRKVTLRHLLSHRAGLPANFAIDWRTVGDQFRNQRRARYRYVAQVLAKPTESEPGSKYVYSNTGFVVAGAMAEKAADEDWEALVRRYVTGPLKMKSVGFGAMGTPGKVDQPWQHRWVDGKPSPCENLRTMDNPPVIGPAGRLHCSIGDLARYMNGHLEGEKGKSELLDKDAFKLLHRPQFGGDYGFGWVTLDRPWADGRALFHNGSNNMNYAAVWMAPSKELGVAAACNCAGPAAEKAVDDAVAACIREILKQ